MPDKKFIEEQVFTSLHKIDALMSQRERSGELPPLAAQRERTDKMPPDAAGKPEDIFQFRKPQDLPRDDDWDIWANNFTDSKFTDVLCYATNKRELWVGKNNGVGVFDFVSSPLPQTKDERWTFFVDKFTYQKLNDVVGYALRDNSLRLGKNNRSGEFKFEWETRSPLPFEDDWRFWTGHFTDPKHNDVLGYATRRNTLWVGKNDGFGKFDFGKEEWARLSTNERRRYARALSSASVDAAAPPASSRRMWINSKCSGESRSAMSSIELASVRRLSRVSKRIRRRRVSLASDERQRNNRR